eukprot:s251_g10.t1
MRWSSGPWARHRRAMTPRRGVVGFATPVCSGSSLTGSPSSTVIEGQRPSSQFPTFSQAFPAPAARDIEVVSRDVQVEVSAGSIRRSSSQLLHSLSGIPLATEPTPPASKPSGTEDLEEGSRALEGYPSQGTTSSKATHSALKSSKEAGRPPVPPVQVRPLLPQEREALYSGLSQAPTGSLAFGRCLQGRRPTPQGSPAEPLDPLLCGLKDELLAFRPPQLKKDGVKPCGRSCSAAAFGVLTAGIVRRARRPRVNAAAKSKGESQPVPDPIGRYYMFILLSTAVRSFEAGVVASMMPAIRTGLHLTYTSQGNVAGSPDASSSCWVLFWVPMSLLCGSDWASVG